MKVISLQSLFYAAILAIVFTAAGRAEERGTAAISRQEIQAKLDYCKTCHGLSGQGYRGYYPMPRLAGQQPKYIENQLRAFIERRRMNPVMFNVAHALSPSMVAALTAYFQDLNPNPLGGGPQDHLALGKTIFEQGLPEANVRPRAQDVFLNRGLDPPHGVGREPKTLIGLEPLDRLHQTDIAFGDDFRDRQAVAAIAHGDLGDQPQMAGNELMRRVAVAVLAPAFGQHEFFLRLQHRKPPDFFKVPGKAGFARQNRQCSSLGHDSALLKMPPRKRRANVDRRSPSRRRQFKFAPAAYTVESGP